MAALWYQTYDKTADVESQADVLVGEACLAPPFEAFVDAAEDQQALE